tara:strand:- start:1888 stop:2706 length:819 start_codon:yes stop_codon:yes gene_type:complete
MLIKDFFFTIKNIHLSFFEKKKILKLFRVGISTLYKFLFLELIIYNFFYKKNLDKFSLKQTDLFEKDLKFLFKYFNSYKLEHGYEEFYHDNFKNIKDKKLDILEIGTAKGDSLASFFFYFPNSNLIGVDNNPFRTRYKSNRIRIIYADISSKNILNNLSNHLGQKFDLIIEDCSHRLIDQILCFSENFKNLKKGGMYVVEDLNFPEIHKMYNPTNEAIDLKSILIKINKGEDISSKFIKNEDLKAIKKEIESIKFSKGIGENSEIVFIKRKS